MPIEFEGLVVYEIPELSQILKIAPNTLRDYLKAGKLRGQKLGKKWYITSDAVKEFFGQSTRAEDSVIDDKADRKDSK